MTSKTVIIKPENPGVAMTDPLLLSLEAIGRRPALEAFQIECRPAVFEAHDGARTPGFASVNVSRSTIAIRFTAPNGFAVPKAGYGESNGKVSALNGSWSAPNVNDAGRASDGACLFGTMELVIGDAAGDIAATRLSIAGASWSGIGELEGQHVIAQSLSHEVVSHHDRRMSVMIGSHVELSRIENLGRACGFVSGIDVEVLRVDYFSADGAAVEVRHQRGYRRVGRGPHSPFTGVADEHRMRAWVAVARAIPGLVRNGVPIDMMIDQISAHNQVAQIHVSAPLLLMATTTAAYHSMHGHSMVGGSASRRPELEQLNRDLDLGLSDADIDRFDGLRVELLETGFFHKPGYETGRPQKDIKFIRDISHAVILRLCGYSGPFYGAEKFTERELAAVKPKSGG